MTKLNTPRWFDWPTQLRLLDALVRVPGELVDHEHGRLSWRTGADAALVVVEQTGTSALGVRTDGAVDEAVAAVRRRLHLALSDEVARRVGELMSDRLGQGVSLHRIPAACSTWAFCLAYLTGGDARHPVTIAVFERLGEPGEDGLVLPPTPQRIARARRAELLELGLKASRVPTLQRLGARFADEPQLGDTAAFAELEPADAVAWLAELPHIGAKRAEQLAAGAFGHEDVAYDPFSLVGLMATDDSPIDRGAAADAIAAAAPHRSAAADSVAVALRG